MNHVVGLAEFGPSAFPGPRIASGHRRRLEVAVGRSGAWAAIAPIGHPGRRPETAAHRQSDREPGRKVIHADTDRDTDTHTGNDTGT